MHELPLSCAACGFPVPEVVVIGGLRRTACPSCHHSQRIDVEPFDYQGFAMGGPGRTPERLSAQAGFVTPHLADGARALEIGCAAGDLAQELRRRKTFALYHGVEFSPARDMAATRMDRVFTRPLQDLLASGEIEAGGYDLVLSSHCLEHLSVPSDVVAAMAQAMTPDALLFLETPNRSGHARLPFDDNRSHIHFFGVSSLTRLLARHGLETIAAETGARHDARYSDSLRVLARRPAPLRADPTLLSSHPRLAGVDRIVVWGAGRMVEEMLAYYLDPARIAFFVDKDAAKQGGVRLGAPVRAPEALEAGADWTVLINSLEFEAPIRAEIETRFGGRVDRIVAIAELLE
ncbi:SAM-dependent methyltransferase [Rhodoblastus acidophilus]|nr:class I SAM-dependent methyltransferase [Rhodoblastus acidophilus]MCW2274710.1 SAM-dependent methyltransferase [Rhodoblastus acidophilus]